MPEATCQFHVSPPPAKVWLFVRNMDNWAACLPGYEGHQESTAQESIWTLRADLQMMQKTVRLGVQIVEEEPPSRLRFTLRGLDENLSGHGEYRSVAAADGGTDIHLTLNMEMGGVLGPLVNALVATAMPGMLKEAADGIAAGVESASAG